MNRGEPTVEIHGEVIEQSFVQMVESAVLHADVEFSHDGRVLADPHGRANPDALEIFARQPLTVALALAWLAAHGRLPR